MLTDQQLKNFWAKVNKTDTCWNWTGAQSPAGYGQFGVGDKTTGFKSVLAHRLSYLLQNGLIPNNLEVMHLCDNPSCVNPDHLRVGTHLENMQDMINKGRDQHGKDPKHDAERLKWILAKRSEGMTYEAIGKGLERAGLGQNVTKQRVRHLVRQHRPDLLGSSTRLKPWRRK